MKNQPTMKTQIMSITPQIAQDMLKRNTKNVPVSKVLVYFYANEMKQGKWRLTGQGISIADDGTLIDGQHRLLAVIAANVTVDFLIISDLDYDEIFTVYDTGRKRTAGNVLGAKGIKNYNNIAAAVSKYIVMKMGKVASRDNIRRGNNITNQDILEEYYKNCSLWDELVQVSDYCYEKLRINKKSYIMGYMAFLILEKKHPIEKVTSFFKQLHLGINVENTSISQLREILIRDGITNYRLTSESRHYLIVKAWNHYITGKQVKIFKYSPAIDGVIAFI